jgi:hypothetical protein
MSEFEQTSRGQSGSGMTELQDELRSLRTLLSASVALLIIFSCSMDFYLLKQVSAVGIQIKASNDYLDAEVHNFNTPMAIEYWNRLVQYSRSHPEFVPIINKYQPALGQTLLGNSAARQ